MAIEIIIGANGLVGKAIISVLQSQGKIALGFSRSYRSPYKFDLLNPDFKIFSDYKVKTAYITAAVTGMQDCENNPGKSHKINVENTKKLIDYLNKNKIYIVFFSSSQVFDGNIKNPNENSLTNPKNMYGKQKIEIENYLLRKNIPSSIIRVTKVLGDQPAGLFKEWFSALKKGSYIYPAGNISLSPVIAGDLANISIQLANKRKEGVWNFSSKTEISYFDAVKLLADIKGYEKKLIHKKKVQDVDISNKYIQKHTFLDTSKLEDVLSYKIKSAEQTLEEIFRNDYWN